MSDEEWIDVSTIGSPYEQQVMIGGIGTRWRHRRRVFSMDFMMTGRSGETAETPWQDGPSPVVREKPQ